jgi:hypothetical protein
MPVGYKMSREAGKRVDLRQTPILENWGVGGVRYHLALKIALIYDMVCTQRGDQEA